MEREFGKAFPFCAHHCGCQQAAQHWEHWAVGCLLKAVQVHRVSAPAALVTCSADTHRVPGLGVRPVLLMPQCSNSRGGSWEVPSGLKTEKIPV